MTNTEAKARPAWAEWALAVLVLPFAFVVMVGGGAGLIWLWQDYRAQLWIGLSVIAVTALISSSVSAAIGRHWRQVRWEDRRRGAAQADAANAEVSGAADGAASAARAARRRVAALIDPLSTADQTELMTEVLAGIEAMQQHLELLVSQVTSEQKVSAGRHAGPVTVDLRDDAFDDYDADDDADNDAAGDEFDADFDADLDADLDATLDPDIDPVLDDGDHDGHADHAVPVPAVAAEPPTVQVPEEPAQPGPEPMADPAQQFEPVQPEPDAPAAPPGHIGARTAIADDPEATAMRPAVPAMEAAPPVQPPPFSPQPQPDPFPDHQSRHEQAARITPHGFKPPGMAPGPSWDIPAPRDPDQVIQLPRDDLNIVRDVAPPAPDPFREQFPEPFREPFPEPFHPGVQDEAGGLADQYLDELPQSLPPGAGGGMPGQLPPGDYVEDLDENEDEEDYFAGEDIDDAPTALMPPVVDDPFPPLGGQQYSSEQFTGDHGRRPRDAR